MCALARNWRARRTSALSRAAADLPGTTEVCPCSDPLRSADLSHSSCCLPRPTCGFGLDPFADAGLRPWEGLGDSTAREAGRTSTPRVHLRCLRRDAELHSLGLSECPCAPVVFVEQCRGQQLAPSTSTGTGRTAGRRIQRLIVPLC